MHIFFIIVCALAVPFSSPTWFIEVAHILFQLWLNLCIYQLSLLPSWENAHGWNRFANVALDCDSGGSFVYCIYLWEIFFLYCILIWGLFLTYVDLSFTLHL
ncbi:hypothetical protein RIF29_11586 [Crotalaria pallida]|uniref:Uncharacterized protein n=1 Tax=Crotalaria pallida TaxID=3830 RepID=A0AAN9IMF9_CROPI